MADYVIWHKPTCSTSRFVLNALREAGITPEVRDYIADPPSEAEITDALRRAGLGARDLLRRKGTPYQELGLSDPALSEGQLIAAMAAHPLLIERPLVFGPAAVILCRPKEWVFELLTPSEA